MAVYRCDLCEAEIPGRGLVRIGNVDVCDKCTGNPISQLLAVMLLERH